MLRQFWFHSLTVLAVVVFAFAFRACGAGRPVKEHLRVGEVAAPPSVQIGLTRVLRLPAVRVRIASPHEVRGVKGVLEKRPSSGWIELKAGGGPVLDGRAYAESPITIVPEIDGTLEVEVERDFRGQPVKAAGVRYSGILHVHVLPPGDRLALVNEVDLEEYLRGVVGKEMNLAEGHEALKAQVIAARTYAVHEQKLDRIRRVKGEKFDLYDDERSQVYGGHERSTPLAARLVDETRGLFLLWEGKLVRTFYSAACGGHTEPAWAVLQDETDRIPPLVGTRCDYCQRRPLYKWKEPVRIPKREIAEKCLPPDLQSATIAGIDISKTFPGGHAQELTIRLAGSSRTVKLQANQEFRRVLAARFRSMLWDVIEDQGDSFVIYGRGYGHGAGMCQTGAYEMAADGRSAAEILEYYFPTAKVRKLY
jgi:stage II sporulation protein D